jgi:HAD superfamily hydrolase (TIGR01509 family)
MHKVRGVILDVDGTLVDSNEAHTNAWVEALAEAGIEVPFSKVRRLIGMGGDKLLPASCGIDESTSEGGTIVKRREAIFRERYLPTLKPFPKAEELLHRMHADDLKLAVASSAKAQEVTALLRICGGDKFIEFKTSSDDTEHSKPDPDIVQAALRLLGLPASEVLMLGDTPYDIGAAHKAGTRIVAVRCGGWGDANLANAVEVYDDPADLLAQYDKSPFKKGLE